MSYELPFGYAGKSKTDETLKTWSAQLKAHQKQVKTDVYGIVEAATTLAATVVEHETRITEAESDISTNTANITTNTTNIAALQGLVNSNQLASGTYTPTLTNSTNVANSSAYLCQYLRVGSVVTVSGRVDIDPTAAAATQLFMSLPIASALAASNELGGAGGSDKNEVLRIIADATNDRAQINYIALGTANTAFGFTFTYRII